MSETHPGPAAPGDERDEIHLLEYWRLLVQRRSVVFSVLASVVAIVAVLTLLATPQYQATTTLQIARQGPDVTNFKEVLGVDPAGYQDFYQTQFKIIQSRTVLRKAVEDLDLPNRPEFAQRKGSPLGRMLRFVKQAIAGAPAESDPLAPAIKFLEEGLGVSPVRNSQLVKISFTDRDRDLAAEIANAVATAYQNFNREAKYQTTADASDFLAKEVARIKGDIAAAEHKLQEYATRKEILALGDLKDIGEQALADLNSRLTEARGRRASAEARWNSVQRAAPDALPEVMNSQLIGKLREEYASVEREHSRMAERFKPDWPALRELTESMTQSRERLRVEIEAIANQVRKTAKAAYDQADAEVATLQTQVDSQKTEVQRTNRENIEFAALKSEIDTKRKVLIDLVARESETQTSERLKDTQASNIRVVDAAEVPERPVSPRKVMNLLLALVVGSGLGVAAAFLLDYLDNTVKDENDIQRMSGLPVLGHVPLYQPLRAVAADGAPDPDAYDPIDLASHTDSKSLFAEAFKNLRTSLLLASPEKPPRKVVVTSFEPSDGKSTVCLNLAIVLTQMGRKVLLVDADLRRPRVHKMLHLGNGQGLSSILSGNARPEDCIQDTPVPNLHVIPSGPVPPNPSELLGSGALQHFIDWAEEEGGYDHVFFDSPPSLQVTDGVLLAGKMDASIIVVRGGKTSKEALSQGAARMRQARGPVAGAVLNAVSEGQGYYYGRYGYYRRYEEDGQTVGPSSAPKTRRVSLRRKRAGQA